MILSLWGGVRGFSADEDVGDALIKQLVFVQQHLAEPGVVDGLESPYDLKVSPDGKHLYVASQRNDAISFFEREPVVGSLTYLGYVDQDDIGENALDGARSLAISPDGKFVYAVSMFSDSLAAFSRDSASGMLTFVDAVYDIDAGVDGLNGARSVVISPDGKNLYVAGFEDSMVSVYSRNLASGVASFQGAYQEKDQGVEELSSPHALSISPDGKHLYVALWKNELVAFDRSAANGLLAYNSKLSYLDAENAGSPGTTRSLVVSPDGNNVYLGSWNTDSLSVFSRDTTTGVLTHLDDVKNSDGGVSDMDGPHAVTISSDGAYVYVAAFSSDSVTSFSRDADTGEVAYFQSIYAEAEDEWETNGPISIEVSPDGEHVYVGSGSGTHSLVTFRRMLLVDPPEFVVQPISKSIEEGESVAFHALAQGVNVSYQWFKDSQKLGDETLPVLSIDSAALGDDGSVFAVEVSNAGGSFLSESATLTVLPPIQVQAPADLTALDISSSSARLSWKDRSDNETSFEIQRRLIGEDYQSVATVLANQIQFENTGLQSATTYRYRLRAKRNETVSLWSNDAVIESFNDVPQAPANLELVEQSYNRVKLSWSDRSAVESGFRILRRIDEIDALWSAVGSADKNATVFTDRTVASGSTYAYRVQAYNESGYSDYSNSVVALTTANPVSSITPLARQVPKDEARDYSISVSSGLDWEAIPSVGWIVVTSPVGGAGTGNQSVNYRVALNTSQSPRVGKVVVGGIEHTVTQEGSPPFLRVSPSRVEVEPQGGSRTIQVEANQAWTATESADWLSIVSGDSGSDNGSVVIEVAANEDFASRLAEVLINDRVVEIEQAGYTEYLEAQASPPNFESLGGTGDLAINSNVDWSATVSENWIELLGPTAGSGDGSIAFKVAETVGTDSRSADILVNSVAITILQSGSSVYLELSSNDTQVGSQAGAGSATIASNIAWSASASQPWIEITSERQGLGDGELAFAFEANNSDWDRVADIIVNDSSISIAQAGKALPVTDIPAPEGMSSTSESLGVAIAWSDVSSDELGFLLSRAPSGSENFEQIAVIAVEKESYLDRAAQRGRSYTYRISSYNADGRSEYVFSDLSVVAGSNFLKVATRAELGDSGGLGLADFGIAGAGELVLQRRGFGAKLGGLSLGFEYPAVRVRYDTDKKTSRLVGPAAEIDLEAYFNFPRFAPLSFAPSRQGIGCGAISQEGEGVFPRGAIAWGDVLGTESAIVIGFEVSGPFELPVLVKGLGPSLTRHGVEGVLTNPAVALYRLADGSEVEKVAENDSWLAWGDAGPISLPDALAESRGPLPDEAGLEAALVVSLSEGRYVAVLTGESSSTGSAQLEVLDLR